ncbi:MAG TPA: hypothetical protein PK400_13785 [Phycisphaerales bacterium]|nr:hypothetical protein [Phycisphaerales bacterium]
MSAMQWTIAVVCSVALIFTIFRLWNKDTRGAFQLAVGVILLAAILITVSGCTVSQAYQPYLETGFAFDTQRTVGDNPACIVRLRQPVGFGPLEPDWLMLSYTHHSSCPMQSDLATVDQIELVAKIPLGRRK